MLTILAWIAALLAGAIAVLLLAASRRPDRFHAARSLQIAASPARIYPLIVDLRAFNTWNPYALRDPTSKVTYQGPASGVGARHDFAGGKSGTGHVTITGVDPDRAVTMRLVMEKPFKADNTVEFTLAPHAGTAGGTTVTWAMHGRQPLLAKVMSMLIDCDRMIGREFEAGLAGLKSKAEGG